MYSCPKCLRELRCNAGSLKTHIRWCGFEIGDLFWNKVDKDGHGGCWVWIGSRKPRGYGHMKVAGKDYNAHRWSYEQANGPIPAGMEVMHKCDRPSCVNPKHLRLGTHAENMADCKAKDRHARGERLKGKAKLTDEQARHILRLKPLVRKAKGIAKELAAQHGVGVGAVHAIWRGSLWKHIQEDQ